MTHDLRFEVWILETDDGCAGGCYARPAAAFRYWQEALDFVRYCRERMIACWTRSTVLPGRRPFVQWYDPTAESTVGVQVQAYGSIGEAVLT